MYNSLNVRIRGLSSPVFIGFFGLFSFLPTMLQIILFFSIGLVPNPSSNPIAAQSLLAQLVTGGVVAPLVETAVFCVAVFWILHRKLRQSLVICIATSSITFAAAHSYDLSSVAVAFVGGLVFSFGYACLLKNLRRAFWSVAAVHALHNIIATGLFFSLKA